MAKSINVRDVATVNNGSYSDQYGVNKGDKGECTAVVGNTHADIRFDYESGPKVLTIPLTDLDVQGDAPVAPTKAAPAPTTTN